MAQKDEDILKLLAAIFDAAKPLSPTVVAGIKDIASFVKDLVTCSDLIELKAEKRQAISSAMREAISSAKEAISQLFVYMEGIEAFAEAVSSERIEKLVKLLQGMEAWPWWKTLFQWIIAGGKQKQLRPFFDEIRERLAVITGQFEVTMEALKNAKTKRDEAEVQCSQALSTTRKRKSVAQGMGRATAGVSYAGAAGLIGGSIAAGIMTGGIGLIVSLAMGGAAAATTGEAATVATVRRVKKMDGLIDRFKNLRRPPKELCESVNDFENLLLESQSKVRGIGQEVNQVEKIATATANQSLSFNAERVRQCFVLLARKAKPLQDQYTHGVHNIQEMSAQIRNI